MPILKALAENGISGERAWAYNGWGVNTVRAVSDRAGLALLRRGRALDPNHYLLAANIGAGLGRLGREEESLLSYKAALALLAERGHDYTIANRVEMLTHAYGSEALLLQGALLEAAEEARIADQAARAASISGNLGGQLSRLAKILVGLHEPGAARAALDQMPQLKSIMLGNLLPTSVPSLTIALEQQDWPAALAAEKDFESWTAQFPGWAEDRSSLVDPPVARALAHMGKFKEAEVRLRATPGDCYPCLRARAEVAELQGQHARADGWFARAVAAGPSLPFAHENWGRALLTRGQPDAAIEKFKLANQKGPKFADPLEGWGEALMAKNQSHRALAKFAEAEKYAPNWGRLHLKWGRALAYSGNKAEAAKHFARAAQLDLTPSEKSELARQK